MGLDASGEQDALQDQILTTVEVQCKVKRQQGKQYEVMHTDTSEEPECGGLARDVARSRYIWQEEFLKKRGETNEASKQMM